MGKRQLSLDVLHLYNENVQGNLLLKIIYPHQFHIPQESSI